MPRPKMPSRLGAQPPRTRDQARSPLGHECSESRDQDGVRCHPLGMAQGSERPRSWLVPYAPRAVERRFDAWHDRFPLAAALLTLVSAVAIIALAVVLLPINPPCIVDLELAGSAQQFQSVRRECGLTVDDVQTALVWDFVFAVVYAVALYTVCVLGAVRIWDGLLRDVAAAAAWMAVTAAAFDVLENTVLLAGVSADPGSPDSLFMIGQGAALAKFIAIATPIVVAMSVLVAVVLRWFGDESPPVVVIDPDAGGSGERAQTWRLNATVPPGQQATGGDGGTGICLSGGGIRSGAFAMGALNALAAARRPDGSRYGLLDDARFLATVSGGGYFGGAMQMLRHRAESSTPSRPIPLEDAFAPGSPEVDHARRNAKYVAEGAGEWSVAIVTVLRNVVFGIGLSWALLAVGAGGLALWYRLTEQWAAPLFLNEPRITGGALIATAIPLVLSLMLWLTTSLGDASSRHARYRMAAVSLVLAAAGAMILMAIPLVVGWLVGTDDRALDERGVVGVGTLTALAATATFIWNVIGRRGAQAVSDTAGRARKLLAKAAFATRFLTTLAVLAAILAVALVVFASSLSQSVVPLFGDSSWASLLPSAAAATAILLAMALLDQTRMSLHPFYKKRLATAFAIERNGAHARQIPYRVLTRISTYGRPVLADGTRPGTASDPSDPPTAPHDEGLRLIVCAAAHVSGKSRGVPGRRVVPFTFASDGIGSPRLGYLDPSDLESLTRRTSYAVDITQTAATALSGAAFASAMGRHSGPFDTVLALTNARLGAWLPNPRYHRLRAAGALPPLERTRTAFPRTRRLQYFLKEVVGLYSLADRFIYVTDGGHYENLGLVELLRRRCTTIYCIDASGDASLAVTLAQAASLAYEELGVEISIEGDALTADTSNGDVDSRMAAKNVLLGTFTYPADPDGTRASGRLIVGKCRLTPEMENDPANFALLTYAATHAEFPNDSTADQWFDGEQFQAYLTLGRVVGAKLAAAAAGNPGSGSG